MCTHSLSGIDLNLTKHKDIQLFVYWSNKRMKECALTIREAANSVALASHNILVNAAKMIDVIFISAKMEEIVLSILSMTFRHRDANVLTLTTVQLAILWLVISLVIMVVNAMVIFVTALKRMELQNIMAKVVICLLFVMEIHVRIVVNVQALFKRLIILRSVSLIFSRFLPYKIRDEPSFETK